MHSGSGQRSSSREIERVHELTFSCFHGYPLLAKDRTCEWLADAIRAACSEHAFLLWAYVFMPNHVHLIACGTHPTTDVVEFVRAIKQRAARQSLAFVPRNSPAWLARLQVQRGSRVEYRFWQRGRGYDRSICEPRTLARMIDYLHLNPVRKGLATRAADWKWSSAGWFLGQTPNSLAPAKMPGEWTVEVEGY